MIIIGWLIKTKETKCVEILTQQNKKHIIVLSHRRLLKVIALDVQLPRAPEIIIITHKQRYDSCQ